MTSTSRSPPQAALTTIFTPPAFCGSYVDASSWLTGPASSSSCIPPFHSGAGYYDDAYYSPAICPSGYTVDCTRFDDYQGPSPLPGETAVICCPRSFSCAAYQDDGCVSGLQSTSTVALSVQIRWQDSDLSRFETPPLTGGLPTPSRHSGWGPASSMTYPYTFRTECSTVSDLWMPFSMESACAPLSGAYYSPAICPSGWTAAFTRPITGDGPPVEPDETAMLCCPSGLTTLSAACDTKCVSATITSDSSGPSIKLVMVREPIQIRWAASDLSVLETHPLIPGHTLNVPAVTITAVPPPYGLYKVALGLAFLPLVVACLAALWGAWIVHHKRMARERSQNAPQQRIFKPRILSMPVLGMLVGFVLSMIVLLEISCHILPPADTHLNLASLGLPNIQISNLTVLRPRDATAAPPVPSITCQADATAGATTIQTLDRGTTATTTSNYGTSLCSVSGTLVALPTCYEPPTAPPPQKWLSAASQGENSSFVPDSEMAVDGAGFLANMLPTLAASLLAIAWKSLALHVASLEPFHQLARPVGSTASRSLLRNYGSFRAVHATMPALATGLVLSSALVTALASEAWGLRLVGNCGPDDNSGCVPVVQVVTPVVHTIQAVLALMVILAGLFMFLSRRWSTGVFADPRSILGIATLAQSVALRRSFAAFEQGTSKKEMKSRIGHIPVALGCETSTADMVSAEYGILISEQAHQWQQNDEPKREQDFGSATPGQMPIPRVSFVIAGLAVFLLGLEALIVYYLVTSFDTGFESFMSGQKFGPRLLFTVCGILINFSWVHIFDSVLCLAPYYSMSSRQATARASILQPYATDPYTALLYGLRSSPFVAATAFPVVLSDFLPLLMANIPFQRTTTWSAHIISSWVTVGFVGFMIVALVVLFVMVIIARPKFFVNAKLLTEAPIAGALVLLCASDSLVEQFHGYSSWNTLERDRTVSELSTKYHLGWTWSETSGYRTTILNT